MVRPPRSRYSSLLLQEGDRVHVQTKELNKVKGEIAFYGEGDFAPGKWVGVRLDDPGSFVGVGVEVREFVLVGMHPDSNLLIFHGSQLEKTTAV